MSRRDRIAPFARSSPSLPMQIAFGAYVYGCVAPVVWALSKLGAAESAASSVVMRRERRLAEKNPFRDYVPGAEDVFVATYAKSGTNWMLQIVHQLIHHGRAEYGHLHDVVPWPDTEAMSRIMRRYAVPLRDATAWRDAPEPLRAIKTHFGWELLPKSDRARYILVIRDPKDVFVSNYHFIRDGVLGPAMPSLEVWYSMFISGKFMGGPWAANAAGYWAERHRPNVLVVSFKGMKRDLAGTVRRVAEFLKIRASDEVLAAVAAKSTFAYMKQIDHKFQIGKLIAWRRPGAMLRKGAQGGASDLVSPERQRGMDRFFQRKLRELGSDLPYEEFADLA